MTMLAIWLAFASAAPQQPPAAGAYGWMCRLREDIAPRTSLELHQPVETGHRYPIGAEVALRPYGFGPPDESLHWTVFEPFDRLDSPRSLSLHIPLRRRDSRGRIEVEHQGGAIVLPSTPRHLYRTGRGDKAVVTIDDPDSLRRIWASPWWRLRILDRKGRLQATAESALPSRQQIEAAFAKAAPALAARAAAAAERCEELGPDASI